MTMRVVNEHRNQTALVEKYIGSAYDKMAALYAQLDTLIALSDQLLAWIGVSATAPTERLDGNPLEEGDRYFNSTTNTSYVYVGAAWVNANKNTTITEVVKVTAEMIAGLTTTIDLSNSYNVGNGELVVFAGGAFQISLEDDPDNGHYVESTSTRIILQDALAINTLVSVVTNNPVPIP